MATDTSIAPLLDAWADELSLTHSPTTVAGYRKELDWFAAWGGTADATRVDLVRYLASRRARGVRENTIKRALSALRVFFKWLRPDDNPAMSIPWPHVKTKLQRTLDVEEVMKVLGACNVPGPAAARNLAIMVLLLDTGLRASETCRLKVSDLDLERRELRVVIKGGNEARAIFSQPTAEALARWLAIRAHYVWPETETVFCDLGHHAGHPMTPSALRLMCSRLARLAGVKSFSTHSLRRTMAVMALRSGASTRIAQIMGRWSDVKLVEVYSRALTERDAEQYLPMAVLNRPRPKVNPLANVDWGAATP